MAYTRNEPVATDDLSVSAPILKDNTNAADDYFGVDHFAFSAASNNGLHKKVTTLTSSPLPTPSGAQAVLYGYQPSANAGVLQFSIGNNSLVPTPLTTLQSLTPITLASSGSTNLFNFTGLTQAICLVTVATTDSANAALNNFGIVTYDGASIGIKTFSSIGLLLTSAGTQLSILNNTGSTVNNIYWTLQFLRVS